MPELPDITVYIESLNARVVGRKLERIQIITPFLLRSAVPPLQSVFGRKVKSMRRIGKRIVFVLEGDLFAVLHLMLSGRLHWYPKGTRLPARVSLAHFEFDNGTLSLTESGGKRRASLYIVQGEADLKRHDPGGLEILDSSLSQFAERLTQGNHTLKRALTDPGLFSGIGNTYSDEILHRARLSPFARTQQLTAEEAQRLYDAARELLESWTQRLRAQARGEFPENIGAGKEGMAVHGRFREPCPVCGAPIQRVRYTERDASYCPRCQTEDRILADRSLSRLLNDDWPKTVEELERSILSRKPK